MEDEILTAEQVANILKVHRFTVLKFIKQGKLKASKLGRVYRIRKSEVDRFLDNQMEHSATPAKTVSSKKKATTVKKTVKSAKDKPLKDSTPEESSKPKQKKAEKSIPEEEVPSPRKNDSDVDHYVLRINDQHDI